MVPQSRPPSLRLLLFLSLCSLCAQSLGHAAEQATLFASGAHCSCRCCMHAPSVLFVCEAARSVPLAAGHSCDTRVGTPTDPFVCGTALCRQQFGYNCTTPAFFIHSCVSDGDTMFEFRPLVLSWIGLFVAVATACAILHSYERRAVRLSPSSSRRSSGALPDVFDGAIDSSMRFAGGRRASMTGREGQDDCLGADGENFGAVAAAGGLQTTVRASSIGADNFITPSPRTPLLGPAWRSSEWEGLSGGFEKRDSAEGAAAEAVAADGGTHVVNVGWAVRRHEGKASPGESK